MHIVPRSYQLEAHNSIYSYFQSNTGNPIVAMPTGTGKAVVIAMFLQSALWYHPGQRIIVLTHVKELVDQNYKKLLTLWPLAPAGVYSAGLNRKEANRHITFAGIASVAKKAHLFGRVDLVLIDEAHLVSPNDETMYRKFLDELKTANPALKVIGLTATPWRLGTGKLVDDGIFTDVCFDITGFHAFNRLIAEGYLAPLITKKTQQVLDVEGVHMRGGEFIASELQVAVDKAEVTEAALRESLELAHDRKHWIVFASGVEHANHIADMLNAMGVSAVAIHSKMGDAERDAAILDFKAGKYRVAVNNNVLTTGFDFPEIDCIIVLRPTSSTVLWVQMLGRGTRPAVGKLNCLVLDFANNTRRLGPINDPVIPRKKGEKTGEAPVKLCMSCGTYNHASARHCCDCGAEFTFQVKIKATASDAEVIKGEMPVVEVFAVDYVTVNRHDKDGRPPMLKVTYYCGLRSFSEFVCIEHEGYAGRKARVWWSERSNGMPYPEKTARALELATELSYSTHLRIWVNKKYPEIIAHDRTGTAFGANPEGARRELPPATVYQGPRPIRTGSVRLEDTQSDRAQHFDEMDDDIPF